MIVTKLTVEDIQIALFKSKIWNNKTDIMLPNLSFGLLEYEADFVVISNAGYLTEVEIKRSFEDLQADFKKNHTHNDPKVSYFYYCLPITMKDKAEELLKRSNNGFLPAIIYYDENGKCTPNSVNPTKKGRKLFLEEQLHAAKLGCLRFWNLKCKTQNTTS